MILTGLSPQRGLEFINKKLAVIFDSCYLSLQSVRVLYIWTVLLLFCKCRSIVKDDDDIVRLMLELNEF